MMLARAVCTASESSRSQKKPIMDFIRRLSVRQQLRSRRRQHSESLPVGQEAKRIDDNTSHSRTFNADHAANERYASSWVDLVSGLTAENDENVSPHVDVDKPVLAVQVASTCNASSIEHPGIGDMQQEPEREEQTAPRRARDKIQRAKSYIAAIPYFKRSYPRVDEPIEANTQRVENDSSKTVPFHAKGKQWTSVDITDAETTARESEEIEKLRRNLFESRAQITELQKHYEAQSRELQGSNSFLNTADKSSDSDVIRALRRLNAEVQQDTTYMADYLAEDFEFNNLEINPTMEQITAAQRASSRIGRILVKSLGTSTPEDIPMILQIAFQAYLTSVPCQAASSWAFEPGYNKFIREMYQRLRRVESQAISGRWRSLARVHNVPSWFTHPESLTKGILAEIVDIALAAGCTSPQSDIIIKVTSKFHEKVSLLVELAGRLSEMFDEVISSDFEVFIALPGQAFKDKMMEDADDGQPGVEEASVLCTTHIGLRKRVPMGTLWEKGRKQKITVLKAKVLLESFLNTKLED